MRRFAGTVQAEGDAREPRPGAQQEGVDLREVEAIADHTPGVLRVAHACDDLWELAVDRGLPAGKRQMCNATVFPLLQHLRQNGERQVPCGGMSLREAVLAAQVTPVGQFDDQAGHVCLLLQRRAGGAPADWDAHTDHAR